MIFMLLRNSESVMGNHEVASPALPHPRGLGRILRHWIFQYRQHGGTGRLIIGSADTVTPAQALQKVRKLRAEVELGGDPQGKKAERREKDSLSLRSVVSDYLAQKTGVKEGTLRMLRTYLEGPLYLKPLHGVPLDRISRKESPPGYSRCQRRVAHPRQ